MPYNQNLVDKIRERLELLNNVEEKYMFGGICFMVDGKMCVGVVKDEMMCRISPELDSIVLEKNGCRAMNFTGKRMKGYIFVSEEGYKNKKEMNYYIDLSLEYNPIAKAAKKKAKKI